jgi:hypothetical protein
VERAEFINAGVVLSCPERRFLGARVGLDLARLAALAPDCAATEVEAQLEAIRRIAAGDRSAGPIAQMGPNERYHWLASPSSTIVGRSESHTGLTDNPAATLDHLFRMLVMTPGARLPRDEAWHGLRRRSSVPDLVGRRIQRIRRVNFTSGAQTNTDDGPIELTLSDGSVLLCDAADDWTLRFFDSAWADVRPAPVSQAERADAEINGRWDAADVTAMEPYNRLAGKPILQSVPSLNELLELTGLILRTEDAILDLQIWAGELRAFVRGC